MKLAGCPVRRPRGQVKPPEATEPVFTASRRLDYELEIGFFFGGPENELGEPIDVDEAAQRVFGLVLLNDWSVRDIQAWEYVPLGPFNSKNFLTTISPWIVTLDALEAFKAPLPPQDPAPLPYLTEQNHSSYDIVLETHIKPPGGSDCKVSTSNMQFLYWSMSQQLAHHTETGCNMRTGDLLGTGTISGPSPDALGCLLELSKGGKEPVALGNNESRTFLNDGDEVTLTGYCVGEGYTVGFGENRSLVVEALRDKYY